LLREEGGFDCITSKSVHGSIPHCQDPVSSRPFLEEVVFLATAAPLDEQGVGFSLAL